MARRQIGQEQLKLADDQRHQAGALDEIAALIFEDLQLPYLEEKAKKAVQSRKTQFNEISRTGVIANLDKRRMILENIRRNAREGKARFGDIREYEDNDG